MIVTAKTVEAINGIRAAGFYAGVKALDTSEGAYDLVAIYGGAVKASVDANGNITYPSSTLEGTTNG